MNGYNDVCKLLDDNCYENVVVFSSPSYADALVGVSTDNRAIYDYQRMVQWLIDKEEMTETEAMEWIDYNTIGALGNGGENGPIIMTPLFREDI